MKTLYTLLAAGSLLVLAPAASQAARRPATDTPTEKPTKVAAREKVATAKAAAKATKAARKSSAHRMRKFSAGLNRAVLVLLGLEDSRAVTSPAKLDRQLHAHQKHLRVKTRMEAKSRRRRTSHMFN